MKRTIAALLAAVLLAPGPAFAQALRFQAPASAVPVTTALPLSAPGVSAPGSISAAPLSGLAPLGAPGLSAVEGLPALEAPSALSAPAPLSGAAPAARGAALPAAPEQAGARAAEAGPKAAELRWLGRSLSAPEAAPAASLDLAFDGSTARKAGAEVSAPSQAGLEAAPAPRAAAKSSPVSVLSKPKSAAASRPWGARAVQWAAGSYALLSANIAMAWPDGGDPYGASTSSPETAWVPLAVFGGMLMFGVMSYGIYKGVQWLKTEGMKPVAQPPEPERVGPTAVDNHGRKVTFDDIAGQEEAKADFLQVLDYLRSPEKYQKKNAKGFKGIILYGPPGTGKTQLARALANEAGVHFEAMAGSEFVEKYVGVGASRVREAFQRLRHNGKGKGILFIDEFDALGRKRKDNGDGNEEYEQTLNQVLKEMDGFDKDPIIVIAATNRLDSIDPALLRGGRFGLKVSVGLPDLAGREAIFKVHTQRQRESGQLADDVDIKELAKSTPGLAGADIEEIVNVAAMSAAYRNAEKIEMVDLRRAVDRQTVGNEIRRIIPEKERKVLAFHEAGHAIVSQLLPNGDPVRKVTIIGNGNGAAGYMQSNSDEERMMHSRAWLTDRMAVALGGRAAELMMTGDSYTGASNDLEVTKNIARQMVMKWGMSSIGVTAYDSDGERPAAGKALSERTKRQIDMEIQKLVNEAYAKAVHVLTVNNGALKAMAGELLEKETLRSEDVVRILAAHPGAQ